MYGNISDPETAPYPPRGTLALYTNTSQSVTGQWGWGFHAVRGGVDPGEISFRPGFSEL